MTLTKEEKATLARQTLMSCGIQLGADFHMLEAWQCCRLERQRQWTRYRPHRNRNGSALRYFHEYLQRCAA